MPSKTKTYDKKIFRLLYILNKLDRGKRVYTRELAKEFNVSLRTVQRDIELLSMTGFPLISLEKGYYSFIKGFSLKKIMLSKEEASLLSFLSDIARSLGENFESSFKDVLKKVLYSSNESAYYAKIPQGMQIKKDLPFIKELENAVKVCQKISVRYKSLAGKEKTYKICPLKIIFYEGFWYLLLQIDEKDWVLKFRLENIQEIEVLDEYFESPPNLKTMLDQSVNIWFSEKSDKKVVLKIDKDVAMFFKDRTYFPLQKIKKTNKDGSLIIESKISQYMEIIPTVFRWIPHIKVLKPEDLKLEIKKRISDYKKAMS